MSKLLSGFLNTSFSTFDSNEVIQIIGAGGGNTLGVDTTGNYIESALEGFGINIANSSTPEGANLTFDVDSSVIATVSSTQTLTNKTIDLTNNTLTGNTAQFNSALSGDNFVTETASQTLTNKTLTLPTIGATGASFAGSSSGAINVQATAIAGSNTVTLPAVTGTLVTEANTATLTNKTINGSNNTLSNIPNAATTATNANTANAIVARDASGNFSAGTITATLSGNASSVTNGVYTTGNQTIAGTKTFSSTISGNIDGNAATVTNGVYTTGDQTIDGTKTFSSTISGSISGNAATVTNGVYTTGNQTIAGTKTFSSTISGNIDGNAATVTNGVYTTGDQTIGGTKTFSSTISGNISGNAATITSQANSATITATSANTANQIVLRDASGNFSAGVMTGTATAARYADLAEKYLADAEYPIGTVMCVGGEAEITASTPELAHSIVGVVSGKPAYLMNNELEGGTIVALKGRVPVRVVGHVNKGDRLTVSGISGCAKADNDAQWTFAIALHSSNTGIVEAIIL